MRQRIADSVITHNEGGAFHFANVGEDNPAVIIELNRIQWNGLRMLNLTSGHIIGMFVQNAKLATIANNYVVDNAGGLMINSTTTSSSNSVYFNITNNIINYNTHGESLHVEGKRINTCFFIKYCKNILKKDLNTRFQMHSILSDYLLL